MLILCPNCSGALPEWLLRTPRTETLCPSCYSGLIVQLFPAVFREAAPIDAKNLALEEGEACCYEHATKRAVSHCNRCGRFLCALCEVDLDGATWCPACLQLDQPHPKAQALERQRTLYDSIALALATWPAFVFFYPSIVTAPIAAYLAIRHWKTPSSLIPRNKWRFIAALIIAFLELALIASVIIALVFFQGRSR